MVADEPDVDAHEQHEHERLDEAYQELEKVEWRGKAPFFDSAHRVHEVLAAKDVPEETERERNRAEEDRDDLDKARAEEDNEQRVVDDRGCVLLVRLVAEDVLEDKGRAGIAHDE